jgi:predicted TIM-barrel enzyme
MQADVSLLKELVEKKIILPENIVIGSGISEINIHDFLPYAKNFIVGSSLKINNILSNHIDSNKVSKLLSTIKQL